MKKRTVNHIPALTWNALRVNGAVIEETPALHPEKTAGFGKLPEGVSCREISFAEALEWLAAAAPEEKPEAVVAGKVPIYHPQAFATGLGAEFDELLEEGGCRVELLEIEDNVRLTEPVHRNLDFEGEGNTFVTILHVGKNAEAVILLDETGRDAENAGAYISTKAVLEEGARLTLVKAQMLGKGRKCFDDTGASLLKDASFSFIRMDLGEGDVYAGVQAELVGKDASFDAKTAYIGRGTQTIDLGYNAVLRGPRTKAEMLFNGVLGGHASKTLRFTIDFRRGAKASLGEEKENLLVLGDDVGIKTMPIILCGEEDMEGHHGATIGQLDEEMLFYMASRGIDRKEAERLMVRARLDTVLRTVPEGGFRTGIAKYTERALEA